MPNDLDTLCVVTLGPNDDGPHSPGELVRELEPWGEIRASVAETATLGGPMTAQFPPTGAAAPGGGIPVPADHDDQDTAPVTVQRQSVRTAFAQQDPPGANRPGTPPPATPTRATGLGAVPSDTETPPTGHAHHHAARLRAAGAPQPAPAAAAAPAVDAPAAGAPGRRPASRLPGRGTASAAARTPPPPEEPLDAFGFSDVIGAETERARHPPDRPDGVHPDRRRRSS